jgi:nitrite reductase/ring-hydroxylating ferredoxin subunit
MAEPMADPRVVSLDVADLALGRTRAVAVDGRKVLVCHADGAFFAVSERCSHAAFSLADGRLAGFLVECPLHGARFDVRDGSAVRRPATKPLDTYAIEVVDGRATIDLSRSAAAPEECR